MRLVLISDAWAPQVNGVVRTLRTTVKILRKRGHVVKVISPNAYPTIACPTYPEIRLAIAPGRRLARALQHYDPDAVHIATEGPLGWTARGWCLRKKIPFTTSFHTHFAEYVALRTGPPASWFWRILRRFHAPSSAIFTATQSLDAELHQHGLRQTRRWSRGVDLTLFRPDGPRLGMLASLPRPLMLHVGRVATEKNIEAFLDVDHPGTKIVVGDGPARAQMEERYPNVRFLGVLHGAELTMAYRSADIFVFPSRTDTFGLVMIEALASGLPVAAYPVRGALDLIGREGRGLSGCNARIGAVDEDLAVAISMALSSDREACVAEGRRYRWAACTDQFLTGLSRRERTRIL